MSFFPEDYKKGTTYYVSADGKGKGLSEADPMPFSDTVKQSYGAGDSLLFKRGDVFYGNVSPEVNAQPDAPFVIGAYGTGARPVISRAKYITNGWEREDRGFYRFDLTNVGSFEGVQDDGANVGFMEDAGGVKHGIRRENAQNCKFQYDFYCDGGFIYVKTFADPYLALGRLTLGNYHLWDPIISISSNTEIRDLHLENGGYGITLRNVEDCRNLYIHDCIIQNIGGTKLGDGEGLVKAGNAIEFFGSAYNALVERNIIRDTYDVGFTIQGGVACHWEDVTVRRNIFAYNTQAFEIWTDGADDETKGVHGMNFIENLCVNQGEGWGTAARPDRIGGGGQVCSTDVLAYGYNAPVLKINITDNTFYNRSDLNRVYSVPSISVRYFEEAFIDRNNIYFPSRHLIFAGTDDGDWEYGRIQLTFDAWRKKYGHDVNGAFYEIKGKDMSKMEETVHYSLDYDEIIETVKSNGIVLSFA